MKLIFICFVRLGDMNFCVEPKYNNIYSITATLLRKIIHTLKKREFLEHFQKFVLVFVISLWKFGMKKSFSEVVFVSLPA